MKENMSTSGGARIQDRWISKPVFKPLSYQGFCVGLDEVWNVNLQQAHDQPLKVGVQLNHPLQKKKIVPVSFGNTKSEVQVRGATFIFVQMLQLLF